MCYNEQIGKRRLKEFTKGLKEGECVEVKYVWLDTFGLPKSEKPMYFKKTKKGLRLAKREGCSKIRRTEITIYAGFGKTRAARELTKRLIGHY